MGQEKAALAFHDATMLERVLAALRPIAAPLVVVGAADRPLAPLPDGVRSTSDRSADVGPLEGLRAGLAAVGGDADVAFVAAVDLPLLSTAFARRVIDRIGSHDAAVPRTRDGIHPLAACYRTRIVPTIEHVLFDGKRAMSDLLDRIDCGFVEADDLTDVDAELRSLVNVNTPEDLARALAAAASGAAKDRR